MSREMKRSMSWKGRLIALVLGVLFAVFAAELLLRVVSRGATVDRWAVPHPRYGFIHRPDFRQTVVRPWVETSYVWRVEINSTGFRGPEQDISDTNALRILLLGDSFTFGYGVEYEETFGALLKQRLEEAGVQALVFNSGVTGWGSAQQFLYASDQLDVLKPDIIIVTFCENDPIEDEVFARGGAKGVLPGFPGKRWIRDHSRLYGAIYHAVSSLLYNRYLLAKQTTSTPTNETPAREEVTVQPVTRFGGIEWLYRTMDLFRGFSDRYRRYNPRGVIVVQVTEFWRNDFRDAMRVLESEGRIRFADLRDDAGDLTSEDIRLPFDPHWNQAMHQISAERLAREILALPEVRAP